MKTRANQSGMALLVSLVLLLLLTIVAITAASQSSLQSRMAANSQQQNIAFQTAESGVQDIAAQIEAAEKAGTLNRAFGPTTATLAAPNANSTATYTASAAEPGNCWNVVPAYSLSVSGSREYSCFNIESTGKSCADSTCKDTDNPARALHFQGHLAKSFN